MSDTYSDARLNGIKALESQTKDFWDQYDTRLSNVEASTGGGPIQITNITDNSTHRLVTDDQIALWTEKGVGNVVTVNGILPDGNGNVAIPLTPVSGTSIQRPVSPLVGTPYYDTSLKKPIWYQGSSTWVDATGTTVSNPVDSTPPVEVTALTAGTITSNAMVLNWTNSTSPDVANYEISYSSDSGVTYKVAGTTTSAGATYTLIGLLPSTSYTLRVIGIDTVGNRSTGSTVTASTIAGPYAPIISDDFNRADSTTSVGATDSYYGSGTSKTWTTFGSGGLGISTNRIYAPTGTGAGYVDAGISDARMEITVTTIGNGHDFYVRLDTNQNYYRYSYNTSGWYFQQETGTFSTIDSFATPTLHANDVVAIEVQGNQARLYINGTLTRTNTMTALLSNTAFGVGFSSTPLGYEDNFKISPLSAPSTGGTTALYTRPTSYLSVADYGATGTASTDVSTNIQNCINDAKTKGTAVVIPAGTYWIDLTKGIIVPSNMTIWFDQGAIIKGLTSSSTFYQMLRLWSVSNVNIIGYPTLIGDKASRPANSSSEGGMGISIANSNNINIDGANVSYCMGDGIYLGDYSGTPYSKTVKVTNSTFDSNNRQGMSVVSAIDLTVDNCIFSNAGGNPAGPGAGVDFEPNTSSQYQQNLNFTNCKFINNTGHGVWGDLYWMNSSGHPISITVSNSTVSGNQGLIYGDPSVQSQIASRSTVAGYVKVNGSLIYNK